MEYETFKERVRQEVVKRCAREGKDCTVQVQDMVRNNGLKQSGLIIMQQVEVASPTVYLDGYYKRYRDRSETMEEIVAEVYDIAMQNQIETDIRAVHDYEKAKSRVIYRLVNTEMNRELLKDVPHKEFLDLSVVFSYLAKSNGQSTSTILIRNSLMRTWGVTADELYRRARENTPALLEARVEGLDDLLARYSCGGIFGNAGEESGLVLKYVLTNRLGIHGAACMIYPNLLRNLAEEQETDFVVLPSSVHEVLLAPVRGKVDVLWLRDIVCDVNREYLPPEDVLSNQAYYFSRKTKRVTILEAEK